VLDSSTNSSASSLEMVSLSSPPAGVGSSLLSSSYPTEGRHNYQAIDSDSSSGSSSGSSSSGSSSGSGAGESGAGVEGVKRFSTIHSGASFEGDVEAPGGVEAAAASATQVQSGSSPHRKGGTSTSTSTSSASGATRGSTGVPKSTSAPSLLLTRRDSYKLDAAASLVRALCESATELQQQTGDRSKFDDTVHGMERNGERRGELVCHTCHR